MARPLWVRYTEMPLVVAKLKHRFAKEAGIPGIRYLDQGSRGRNGTFQLRSIQ